MIPTPEPFLSEPLAHLERMPLFQEVVFELNVTPLGIRYGPEVLAARLATARRFLASHEVRVGGDVLMSFHLRGPNRSAESSGLDRGGHCGAGNRNHDLTLLVASK